jgi:tRNA modification GTPase
VVPDGGETIDEVLLIKMEAPRTYTRENIVEIHCHGGHVVTGRILSLVLKAGARPAEPGEFTKRAFFNGRIDLSQAEAIMDIIQARTQTGSRAAVRQLEGSLSLRLSNLRGLLVDILSKLRFIWITPSMMPRRSRRHRPEKTAGQVFK